MITLILLSISVLVNLVFGWGLINSSRKLEIYERSIVRFHNGALTILQTARAIDEREMFEKDDDVGVLFEQLLTVIGELRVLIYAEEEEEQYENILAI